MNCDFQKTLDMRLKCDIIMKKRGDTMEKVIIIGCPGSGKSTFGRKLKRITGLPLFHLDMMFWNEDKTTVSKEVFTARLREAMSNPESMTY